MRSRTCGCNYETLIHAASAGTTRIAAATAWRAGMGRCAGFFASHSKAGQLLTQPFALTFGASGFLFAHYDGLKLVVAFLAHVFKNRHILARLKYYSLIIIGELARVDF